MLLYNLTRSERPNFWMISVWGGGGSMPPLWYISGPIQELEKLIFIFYFYQLLIKLYNLDFNIIIYLICIKCGIYF